MSGESSYIDDIAIVGIGCRYPGGSDNPQAFWEMLCRGTDTVRQVPTDRWNTKRYLDKSGNTPGTMRMDQAAFIDQPVDAFDAEFFGISPREAECIDPQHRLLLEVVWEAFEDAGIPPSSLSGNNVGVYAGGFTLDYYADQVNSLSKSTLSQYTGTGGTLGMMSNRLSYWLDFRGPSLTIDTACSSSLVALHYACEDLRHQRTFMAVVTGVNIMLNPMTTNIMSKGQFLSSDGRSKAFDASADGYGRGEGAGAVILKPLQQAISDGDRIYSVIKASGVNQDGRTEGIASPNGDAQEALISSILSESGINPDGIVLIEAHGTGTAIGDPTEVNALARSLSADENRPRYLSSVKANIGHQEAGAGIASIIKASLCLLNEQVPPQINITQPNPAIDFAGSGFLLAEQLEPLPESKIESRHACVNSFGFGGTNAHVILAESPVTDLQESLSQPTGMAQILCLSARSPQALSVLCERYIQRLAQTTQTDLMDLCYSAAQRREHHPVRLAVVSSSNEGMSIQLKNYLQQKDLSKPADSSGLVWVFTGMGPQWWAMGRQLYQQEEVFRSAFDKACQAFERHAGWSLIDEIFKDEQHSRMAHNEIAQPANFVLQAALSELWRSWGVIPDAIVGHSIGEVGAALAAGAIDLDSAALIAFHRSRLQQTLAGQGRLLAIGVDEDTARNIVALYEDKISLAAINSPASCALSGDEATLLEISTSLDAEGIFQRMVMGEIAYHSLQMQTLEQELKHCLQNIVTNKPATPLYSTVTGKLVATASYDADYWWHNVRQPVNFATAISQILQDGHQEFIEIGPHPVLSAAIQECAQSPDLDIVVLPTLQRKMDERQSMLLSVARLYARGHDPRWSTIMPEGRFVDVPLYPWERKKYWNYSYEITRQRTAALVHPWLGSRESSPQYTWIGVLPNQYTSDILDHVVNRQVVFPASGYVEIFLAAASDRYEQETLGLSDVKFHNLLFLGDGDYVQTKIILDADKGVQMYTRNANSTEDWIFQASARVTTVPYHAVKTQLDYRAVLARCPQHLKQIDIYARLTDRQLQYGPAFQTLESVQLSHNELLAVVRKPKVTQSYDTYHLSPALIDGCLQTLALFGLDNLPAVPVAIDEVRIFSSLPERFYCHTKLMKVDDKGVSAQISIYDHDYVLCVQLTGIQTKYLPTQDSNLTDQYSWRWQTVDDKQKNDESNPPEIIWQAELREDDLYGERLSLAFIYLVQELSKQPPCHLKVVSNHAQYVVPGDKINPAIAALWGAARVARCEYPALNISLVDKSDSANNDLPEGILPGGEYAIRNQQLYEHLLVNGKPRAFLTPIRQGRDRFTLMPGVNGSLSAMYYESVESTEIQPHEVEVCVHYAAVNMKDVLKALGRLDAQAMESTLFGDKLGLEGVGYVEQVGDKVTDFEAGDKVLVCCPTGTFNPYVTINTDIAPLLKWRGKESLEQLAGIQVAFVTAERALVDIANLQSGEFVLLHSAAGGVGHAALQVANRIGARVLATASTEEKRQLILDMGAEQVFDSRSLNFVEEVMQATGGKGVDVALNFLSGDAFLASLSCMAQFGRFVEIGKEDISNHGVLPLKYFQQNLLFASVDIDRLIYSRLDVFMGLLERIQNYFDEGLYTPVPTHVYPATQTDKAFQQLLKSSHTGKVAIDLTQSGTDELVLNSAGINLHQVIDSTAGYLITGGFGGFGLQTAFWLARHGARHILLVGRRGAVSDDAIESIATLRQQGVSVIEIAADVSEEAVIRRLLKGWHKDAPAIKGVFHCAAVLDDALIVNQSADKFQTVFRAKVTPAKLLHDISLELGLKLDLFVLFSSVSAVIGNSGQANYVAANAYLDALAAKRRALGHHALSVAWGAISDVGMLANNQTMLNHLQHRGLHAVTAQNALKQLESALRTGTEHVGLFSLDWQRWYEQQFVNDIPVFRLVKDSSQDNTQDAAHWRENILSMSADEAHQTLLELVTETLTGVLQLSPDSIDRKTILNTFGMDSLMLLEFNISLQKSLDIKILASDIIPTMSVDRVVEKILVILKKTMATTNVDHPIDDLENNSDQIDVDVLPDEEVQRLLDNMLSENSQVVR